MAITIPSVSLARPTHHPLAVVARRWAVRLILAILLAISALLAFGALSAAAPTARHATSHSTTAGVGIKPLCQVAEAGC